MLYDDGNIACNETSLFIRHYWSRRRPAPTTPELLVYRSCTPPILGADGPLKPSLRPVPPAGIEPAHAV
jgi:hypothetical protein